MLRCKFFIFLLLQLPFSLFADKLTLQKDYKLFETKCSKCHSLQISLTGPELTPTTLQSVISRMSQMSGANISSEEQKDILDFMIYYTAASKKGPLKSALQALPSNLQQSELEKIKQAIAKYQ